MRRPAAPPRRDSSIRQTLPSANQETWTFSSNVREQFGQASDKRPSGRRILENLPLLLSLFIKNRDETFRILPAAAVTLKVT